MSDEQEKPNFIERAQGIARNWTGEEWSPDRLVEEFYLYSHPKRAAALDEFDREMAESGPVPLADVRKYSELTSLHGRLRDVHHKLRKAGR